MYFRCFHATRQDIEFYRELITKLTEVCTVEELEVEDKICMLNVAFAEFYTFQQWKNADEMHFLRKIAYDIARTSKTF